jgi:uncharacterized protein (TIGR03435 family)
VSLGLVALLSTVVLAQSGASAPAFVIADVHVRPHSSDPNPFMTGGGLRGERFDLRNATMLDLITFAYGVDAGTVLGGPSWLDRKRFDILAKAPQNTTREDLKLMLQGLLASRFTLTIHKDTRPVPSTTVTVVGDKPKMKAVTAETAGMSACTPSQAIPAGGIALMTLSCHGASMATFVDWLRNMGNGYITTRVVDQTGLTGAWDFDVKWNPRYSVIQPGVEFTTMFAALEQQLGLKLTLQDVPAPVLVVDSVNDVPTPNPSGVDAALPPPPPAEFDVADIKVSAPDARTMGRLQPNGRLDFQGYTMKQLVTLAWDIRDDELLAGAPGWFNTTKYSIVAKASEVIGDQGFNFDDLRLMVRALLKERFNMATHLEDRPVTAYSLLVADKPKLQAADPSHRSKCQDAAAGPGQKDPRETNPMLNVWKVCQNVTMAEFAEDLSVLAPSYLRQPVVDATGLSGAYDLTLSWSAYNIVYATSQGDSGAGGTLGASTPSGALSLFDALQKQLGLKLELRKRPMPVLVIDRINEQPSDN